MTLSISTTYTLNSHFSSRLILPYSTANENIIENIETFKYVFLNFPSSGPINTHLQKMFADK
jgi:hypothetical protein